MSKKVMKYYYIPIAIFTPVIVFVATQDHLVHYYNYSMFLLVRYTLRLIILGFGTLSFITFIISGIVYFTTSRDSERVKAIKRMIIYCIEGTIATLLAIFLLNLVSSM